MQLKNAVMIVTGGSNGIGLSLVKKALAQGSRVLIADLSSPPKDIMVMQLLVILISLDLLASNNLYIKGY